MTASRLIFLVILMLGLLAAPLVPEAQQAGRVYRLGIPPSVLIRADEIIQ